MQETMNDGLGNEKYNISLLTNDLECLFVEITLTNIQHFVAAVVYHPPTPICDPIVFLDFLSNSCESVLSNYPSWLFMPDGAVNKLDIWPLLNQFSSDQIVKTETKDANILDVFITNTTWDFGKVSCMKSIIHSDPKKVFIYPRSKQLEFKVTTEG